MYHVLRLVYSFFVFLKNIVCDSRRLQAASGGNAVHSPFGKLLIVWGYFLLNSKIIHKTSLLNVCVCEYGEDEAASVQC